MPAPRRPLLGSLANTPWLSRHGEVLAVQCLSFLLEDPACAEALRQRLASTADLQVPRGLEWLSESVEEAGRPDLSGTVPGEARPRVVLEAKFDHLITVEQIQAYLGHLAQHPQPSLTALVLLVPEHRRAEADRALAQRQGNENSKVGVLSWDGIVGALRDACGSDADLLADVRQFEALCETYGGKDIRPFTAEEIRAWPARVEDLKVIVDRVTAGLSTERLLPIGLEKDATSDGLGYYRRYVSGERGPEGTWMSIGVREPRVGFDTPIWLRYHARTGALQQARGRLEAAGIAISVARRGHVYVPLWLPAGVSGVQVVRQLEQQAAKVHSAALGRPWPSNDA